MSWKGNRSRVVQIASGAMYLLNAKVLTLTQGARNRGRWGSKNVDTARILNIVLLSLPFPCHSLSLLACSGPNFTKALEPEACRVSAGLCCRQVQGTIHKQTAVCKHREFKAHAFISITSIPQQLSLTAVNLFKIPYLTLPSLADPTTRFRCPQGITEHALTSESDHRRDEFSLTAKTPDATHVVRQGHSFANASNGEAKQS